MVFRIFFICILFINLSCSQNSEQKEVSPKSEHSEKKQTKLSVPVTEKEQQSETDQKKSAFPKSFTGKLNSAPEQWLAKEELEQGWLSLFDGQTLYGWRATSNANWSVKEGVIQADSGNPGFLMTPFRLGNYILRCEYRLEKEGNSGLFLRTPMNPKDPSKDCYEFNLCDSHKDFATGSLVGRKKVEFRGGPVDEWRTVWVKVEENKIIAKINGKDVLNFEDKSADAIQSGHIGLQMNGGKVEFRNVAILPLGAKEIFTKNDLSGWNVVPGSKSLFSVKDDYLHIENGVGFLETEKKWSDFLLHSQVRTNGENLNGGIFFRAIKGTEKAPSNGYELQVHNGFANSDRSQPNDYKTGFGTGAIFRRAKVRWVNSNDKEWLSMTLIAQGPSFYTWVNGLQVVDFTDIRKKNDNPRKGLKVKEGHLSLQGHDETTNIDFRTISIIALDE